MEERGPELNKNTSSVCQRLRTKTWHFVEFYEKETIHMRMLEYFFLFDNHQSGKRHRLNPGTNVITNFEFIVITV